MIVIIYGMPNKDENKETETPKTEILTELQRFGFRVPICCREGHADCEHRAKPAVKVKRNVGL